MLKPINDNRDAKTPASRLGRPYRPSFRVRPAASAGRAAPMSKHLSLPAGWTVLYPDDNSKQPGRFAVLDKDLIVRAWLDPDAVVTVCNLMRRIVADRAQFGETKSLING